MGEFMLTNKKVDYVAIYPSRWALDASKKYLPRPFFDLNVTSVVIHNPLMSDILQYYTANATQDRGFSFVWAASFERGARVALRVFNKLGIFPPSSQLSFMSYFTGQPGKLPIPGKLLQLRTSSTLTHC